MTNLTREGLIELACGDESLLKQLVSIFLRRAPQLLIEIRECLVRRDIEKLKRATHDYRGSAGVFGETAVIDAALALEDAIEIGDFERAGANFETLERAALELETTLRSLVDPISTT